MFRKKSSSADLVRLIQDQNLSGDAEDAIKQDYDETTEKIALSRFRICLTVFLLLVPLLASIDYFTRGFPDPRLSFAIRSLMVGVLFVFSGLTVIHQFKRNIYAFTFLLTLLMGVYNIMILLVEGEAAVEHYIVYALIFSLVGVVMPWGGKAMAGICIPAYLLYPIGIILGQIPMTGNFFLKSNLYLILFILIVIVGASLNSMFRYQEFLLKKRMETVNRVLEDYQTRLKRSYQRLENIAIIDHLTGVYNRTYLNHWLTTEIHKNKDAKEIFSMIMFDLDQFKDVNDFAGHQMGDRVLQRMTEIVQESVGDAAPIFRYGGDEFCIILPGYNLARAVRAAEKVRLAVAAHPDMTVKYSHTESLKVTVSMGVISEFVSGAIDADYLIKWADAALLESKRQGRNRINVFEPEERKIRSAERWLNPPADSA